MESSISTLASHDDMVQPAVPPPAHQGVLSGELRRVMDRILVVCGLSVSRGLLILKPDNRTYDRVL